MNANPFHGPQESLPLFIYRFIRTQSSADIQRGYAGALVAHGVSSACSSWPGSSGGTGRWPDNVRFGSAFPASTRRPTAEPRLISSTSWRSARSPLAGSSHSSDHAEVSLNHRSGADENKIAKARATRTRVVTAADGHKAAPTLIGGPPPGAATLGGPRCMRLVRRPPGPRGRGPDDGGRRGDRTHRPLGCGKSTFLRLLNRMHELVPGSAMAGEILLDGVDIYGAACGPNIRTRIGMVFQKPNPFPAMSVRRQRAGRAEAHPDPLQRSGRPGRTVPQRAGLWREVRERLDSRAGRCRAASNSGSASRGHWRSPRTSCSWTSRAQP